MNYLLRTRDSAKTRIWATWASWRHPEPLHRVPTRSRSCDSRPARHRRRQRRSTSSSSSRIGPNFRARGGNSFGDRLRQDSRRSGFVLRNSKRRKRRSGEPRRRRATWAVSGTAFVSWPWPRPKRWSRVWANSTKVFSGTKIRTEPSPSSLPIRILTSCRWATILY